MTGTCIQEMNARTRAVEPVSSVCMIIDVSIFSSRRMLVILHVLIFYSL